jgi:hypothetical protein
MSRRKSGNLAEYSPLRYSLLGEQDFTCGEVYESPHPVRIRGSSPIKTAHLRDLSDYGMQSKGQHFGL